MAWRLAGSLVVLRNQIDAMAPNRSRASDGTIGDASHASRCSRHNPNGADVVTALDITHDPARGCDIHAIADQIRRNPHPELAYVISAGRIAGRSTGWGWHVYTGSNKHSIHAHFGVGQGSDCAPFAPYDSAQLWAIDAPQEEDMNDAERALLKQAAADAAQARMYAKAAFDLATPNGFSYVIPATGQRVAEGTPGSVPAGDIWRWARESVEIDREDDDRHRELTELLAETHPGPEDAA